MQVILKETVYGLGYKDDIVTVKNGYGRNYLIPQGKAVIASKSAVKQLEEELRQRARKIAQLKAEAEAQAERIRTVKPIVIATKVSATGTIYGSVNSLHLAEALAAQGIELDRRQINVHDVKEVGNYTAVVKVYKGVEAELPFTVVAENAEEYEAAKAAAKAEAEAAKKAEAEAAAAAEEAPAAAEEAPAAAEETTEVASLEA